MTIQEFYTAVSGNYAEVYGRLMTDKRICKYLLKFKDCDDYQNLEDAIDAGNWPDAFRFSHNLKGMCLNLSLTALATVSSDLCEEFRNGAPQKDISSMNDDVKREYARVIEALGSLEVVA